jgi:hypothetical protein
MRADDCGSSTFLKFSFVLVNHLQIVCGTVLVCHCLHLSEMIAPVWLKLNFPVSCEHEKPSPFVLFFFVIDFFYFFVEHSSYLKY